MKHLFISFLLIAFPLQLLMADPEGEKVYIDTTITHNGYSIHLKEMKKEEFEPLYKKNFIEPQAITDIEKLKKVLGKKFELDCAGSGEYMTITSVHKINEFRVFMCENEGFQAFFPKERIFLYFGGHSSDQAFFIDSAEPAYNPRYSAVSPNGNFRLAGLHSGQDNVDYDFEVYREGKYEKLFSLWEFSGKVRFTNFYVGYIEKQFWIDNTLYFEIGGGYSQYESPEYFSITLDSGTKNMEHGSKD